MLGGAGYCCRTAWAQHFQKSHMPWMILSPEQPAFLLPFVRKGPSDGATRCEGKVAAAVHCAECGV